MANNDMDRVVPLGQLDDYKVAEGDPDVRGWDVLASDGRKIGEVDELLVDTSAMKVRYLDVDVEDGVIGDGMDRHVLIPIGYARLEQEHDRVMVDGLASSDLQALPAYDQGPLTRDFESSVRDSFSRRGTTSTATDAGLTAPGMTAAGMSGAGAGMLDTAGLDNTPGTGTGMGMSGTTAGAGLAGVDTGSRAETARLGEDVPAGEGMRAAGYDRGSANPMQPGTGLHDTGSARTGLDSGLGTTGGMSAGAANPRHGDSSGSGGPFSGSSTEVSGTGRNDAMRADEDATLVGGMSAGAANPGHGGSTLGGGTSSGLSAGPGVGSETGHTELGGTGRGDAMRADEDATLVGGMSAGAGSQGPVSGMGTDRGPQGDMSHRASTGSAGSDYQHNADEDFYASDAFDDSRFYGARRGGTTGGGLGGGSSVSGSGLQGGGLGASTGAAGESMRGASSDPGGMGDSMGADRDETARLAREASERLREDQQNRGVGGSGGV